MSVRLNQPVRKITYGSVVIDQFPVYLNSDGYTKVSGLTTSDLPRTVYRDGTVVSISTTVTEIASGEYKLQFTPNAVGYWQVEILYAAQSLAWKAAYEVGTDGVLSGQYFKEVVRDIDGNGLPYVLVEVLTSGTSTVLTSTTTAFDGSYSFALTGSLSGNPLVDLRFSGSNYPAITKVGLRLG